MDRREARVTMDRPRFAQGLTFDGYKRQMTRNRERFEENERRVELRPDDVAAFQQLPRPPHVVVLAEDWCGGVIANLPVDGPLAQAPGKLDLRVVLREQNHALM